MTKANIAAEAQEYFKHAARVAADFGIPKTAESLADHWCEYMCEMRADNGEPEWTDEEVRTYIDAMAQELIKLGLPSEA